ncbi:FAD-dependent monooxygenase [Streptomyces lunaelactis]|uniref:FAD-dependent monooxygenase n=1 Tax=Streptomyces lunaelactis TaxID=1535768 RepID=UPI00211D9229|nr:FAD-dependent monooxygenase [Streptomyces lunaelactis]
MPRPELNNLLADTIGRDRIRLDAHVTGYTETGSDVAVHLANGETLRTDLLIGSDGVHSHVRKQLVPGSDAVTHSGHYAWRAIVPTGNQKPEATVLTVGHRRTRGGYARIARDRTVWMVNSSMPDRSPEASANGHWNAHGIWPRLDGTTISCP